MKQSCKVTSDNRSLLFAVQLLGGKFAKFSSAWTWQRGAAVPVEDYLPSLASHKEIIKMWFISTHDGDGVHHFKFD